MFLLERKTSETQRPPPPTAKTSPPSPKPDCGSGGCWSKGDTRPLTRDTRDGQQPGCEEDPLLPMPPDIGFTEGKDDAVSLVVLGADIVTSTGDGELLRGTGTLDRLW